jgi:hypothetical protein
MGKKSQERRRAALAAAASAGPALVLPTVVPGWITESVGDYQRMFHGAFDFASPVATYGRCDDIARLLYRHLLGAAPRTCR